MDLMLSPSAAESSLVNWIPFLTLKSNSLLFSATSLIAFPLSFSSPSRSTEPTSLSIVPSPIIFRDTSCSSFSDSAMFPNVLSKAAFFAASDAILYFVATATRTVAAVPRSIIGLAIGLLNSFVNLITSLLSFRALTAACNVVIPPAIPASTATVESPFAKSHFPSENIGAVNSFNPFPASSAFRFIVGYHTPILSDTLSENLYTSFVASCVASLSGFENPSYARIPASCIALSRIFKSPQRLSILTFDILFSAPPALSRSSRSASHSVLPSASVLFKLCSISLSAATFRLPPSAESAAFLCSSLMFRVASFTRIIVFFRPMNLPSSSNADTPSLSIIFPALPAPVVRLIKTDRNAVPASSAFKPRFASTPNAVADSSIGTCKSCNCAPVLIYPSNSCSAVWFERLFAFAATSRKRARSPASVPVADIASVTRSLVLARSRFVASESFKTLGSALIDVFTSHPASAMYFKASADSVAVFVVLRPQRSAASLAFSYCALLASAVADHSSMCFSNSDPTSYAFLSATPVATPAAAPTFATADAMPVAFFQIPDSVL